MTSTSDAPHKVYRDRFEVIFAKGGATIGLFVTRGWLQNALDARGLPLARELSDQDFAHHVFRCCETNDMLAHAIASRNNGGRAFGKSVTGVRYVEDDALTALLDGSTIAVPMQIIEGIKAKLRWLENAGPEDESQADYLCPDKDGHLWVLSAGSIGVAPALRIIAQEDGTHEVHVINVCDGTLTARSAIDLSDPGAAIRSALDVWEATEV